MPNVSNKDASTRTDQHICSSCADPEGGGGGGGGGGGAGVQTPPPPEKSQKYRVS